VPLGAGGEALLAAVDAYGHVTLSRLRGGGTAAASAAGDADGAYLAAAAALAPRSDTVEPSWAGVSFAPGAHATLATARHLSKAVRFLLRRCSAGAAVGLTHTRPLCRRWMCMTATCTFVASTRPPTPPLYASCALPLSFLGCHLLL